MKSHRGNNILLQRQLRLGHINAHLRPQIHQRLCPIGPYLGNFDANKVAFTLEDL